MGPATRRIWSTLLDRRDWTSYVYVPLIIPILVLLPYLVVRYYQRSHRLNLLFNALSQGRPGLVQMIRMLDQGPEPRFTGAAAEEVSKFDEPDLTGFEIIQDSCISDLRLWRPGQPDKGDLIVMGGMCQRTWQHSVPKVAHAAPRMSVTVRTIEGDEQYLQGRIRKRAGAER